MKKESSVRQEYEKIDKKSPEHERDRGASGDRYRKWCVENFTLISEDALIGLFGCRGMHEIKAEWELSNMPSETPLLESNTVEEVKTVRQPKFDKAAYQLEYMRKKRLADKLAKEALKEKQ